MKFKTFISISIFGTLFILLMAGMTVYYVDPYLQYHKPNDRFQYNMEMNDFDAINPGIARNYDYDTIITGSSMSRSFLPSYIDEKFSCKTVKLSMAEARGKDFKDLFSVVSEHKNLKRVIMGLDTFAFTVDKDFSSYQKPLYLYDDFMINDMLYLVNMDGLVKSYETVVYTRAGGKTLTQDEYQNYALSNTFSKEKVVDIFKNKTNVKHITEYDVEAQTKTIVENLNKNIVPFIKQNPEIDFFFYFPPYSIVRWGITENQKAEIHAMQVIIEELLPYENVSIYFYQGKTEVITNLNNYMDTIHFSSDVANDIVDEMADEGNRLTESNYMNVLEGFYRFVREYDYDSLGE